MQLFPILAIFAVGFATPSAAAVITAVSDPASTDARVITSDEGVAIGFNLLTDATNVSVTAPIDCISCTGEVFLTNDIGTGAGLGNLVDRFDLTTLSAGPLFEGLTLTSGTYYLGLGIDSGFSTWGATLAPLVTNTTEGSIAPQYAVSGLNSGYVPASDFLVVFANDPLLFSISAEITVDPGPIDPGPVNEVPLPASSLLLLGALATLALRRRTAAS